MANSPNKVAAGATLLSACLLLLSAVGTQAHDRHRGIPHIAPTPLITQTCTAAPFPEFCTFALTGNPLAARFDVSGLARVGIEGAIKKAAMVDIRITNLLRRNHQPSLQQCIRACSGNYAQATAFLRSAIDGLSRPLGQVTACGLLDAAVAEVHKCEAGCQAQRYEKFVLSSRNGDFVKFCLNAKAIVQMDGLMLKLH